MNECMVNKDNSSSVTAVIVSKAIRAERRQTTENTLHIFMIKTVVTLSIFL